MLARRIMFALGAMLLAVPVALAQEGTVKIAVCNPAKVFEKMDKRKVIEERMRSDRDKVRAEAARRQQEVKQKQEEQAALRPDSELYRSKGEEIMSLAVQFEVWARLREQEMNRMEKEQIKALYEEIREATKEVAETKKVDLVLSERKPEIPADMSKLTPDQLRAIISQSDVLYVNDKADITADVTNLLNKKYATAGSGEKAPEKK